MVLSMERWVGKVAVVTGASAGIGLAIAEQLVEAGLKVVGIARRKDKLDALAQKLSDKKGKLYAFKADITKENEVLEAIEWTKKNVGSIHILINSAGAMKRQDIINGDTVVWKNAFDLNVIGLLVATREAIKDMQANNVNGHIIHLNSVVGHKVFNFPGGNVYAATKHAVTALTETLRLELNRINSKIRITSVSPGFVRTEFQDTAGVGGAEMDTWPALQAEDVADAIIYVLSTPPHVQVHELTIKPVNEIF